MHDVKLVESMQALRANIEALQTQVRAFYATTRQLAEVLNTVSCIRFEALLCGCFSYIVGSVKIANQQACDYYHHVEYYSQRAD